MLNVIELRPEYNVYDTCLNFIKVSVITQSDLVLIFIPQHRNSDNSFDCATN